MASLPGTSGYSSAAYGRESTVSLEPSGSSQPSESGIPATINGETNSRGASGPRGVFVAGFKELPPALAEWPAGIGPGKYKIVSLAMDITGRRLIDEIYFISGYSYPGKYFKQYVMIHGSLNPWARHWHRIRVRSTGFTRIIKSIGTRMKIYTLTEYKALLEFFAWLESIKEADEKIILLYHEPRRLTTIKLIQAILRYNLMETFKNIVAGFCDSFAMCHDKCGMLLPSGSLALMSKFLLDPEIMNIGLDRASCMYSVLEQLAYQENVLYDEAVGGEGYEIFSIENMKIQLACTFGRPVETELYAYFSIKDLIKRQDTFRVVFVPLLMDTEEQRWQFTKMRRRLAEAGLFYDQVRDAWIDGRRRGVANLLFPLGEVITEYEMQELIDIFAAYFSPMFAEKTFDEIDELFWSSDEEDLSEGVESRNSPSTPSSPPLVGVPSDERPRTEPPRGAMVRDFMMCSGVLQIRYILTNRRTKFEDRGNL